jgi:hypothetical protein
VESAYTATAPSSQEHHAAKIIASQATKSFLKIKERAPPLSTQNNFGPAQHRMPFHRIPIAHLRQDRTPPGYAVKALLARSVLAFGCAPHAACGGVHDGARTHATVPARR